MNYPLPQPGTQSISLNDAVAMTTRFRNNRATILGSNYQSALCNSETFNGTDVTTLLTGATALRIYYGMDEDLKVHALLVAVDEEGKDILPASDTLTGNDDIFIMEQGIRCPPICPPESDLNP